MEQERAITQSDHYDILLMDVLQRHYYIRKSVVFKMLQVSCVVESQHFHILLKHSNSLYLVEVVDLVDVVIVRGGVVGIHFVEVIRASSASDYIDF